MDEARTRHGTWDWALVGFGTLAMLVALWNYWSINKSLVVMNDLFPVPQELKLR